MSINKKKKIRQSEIYIYIYIYILAINLLSYILYAVINAKKLCMDEPIPWINQWPLNIWCAATVILPPIKCDEVYSVCSICDYIDCCHCMLFFGKKLQFILLLVSIERSLSICSVKTSAYKTDWFSFSIVNDNIVMLLSDILKKNNITHLPVKVFAKFKNMNSYDCNCLGRVCHHYIQHCMFKDISESAAILSSILWRYKNHNLLCFLIYLSYSKYYLYDAWYDIYIYTYKTDKFI